MQAGGGGKGRNSARDLKFKGGNAGEGFFSASYCPHVMKAQVARTDVAAKNLFILPADAVIDEIVIYGPVGSNAGTTAVLSVGKTGTNTFYLNVASVLGNAGLGYLLLNGASAPANVGGLTAIGAAIQVVGIYAETGAASTLGGPWDVEVWYHIAP